MKHLVSLLGTLVAIAALASTAAAEREQKGFSFQFLGTTYCAGQVDDTTRCDVRVPSAHERAAPADRARTLSLLGVKMCLGQPPAADDCDLVLPDKGQHRAATERAQIERDSNKSCAGGLLPDFVCRMTGPEAGATARGAAPEPDRG